MVQNLGTISSPGTIAISDIQRYEHHKVYVKVTNYVSSVTLRIEDITVGSSDAVNLSQNGDETITDNGTYCYLIENSRMDDMQVNFVSGDATIEVYYTGW